MLIMMYAISLLFHMEAQRLDTRQSLKLLRWFAKGHKDTAYFNTTA